MDSKKVYTRSDTNPRRNVIKSHSQKLILEHSKGLYALSEGQKGFEKVMPELMINLRLNEASVPKRAGQYIRAIAPATELLFECKGSGTL